MLQSIQSAASKVVDFLGYVPGISTPIGLAQIIHGYAIKKFSESRADRETDEGAARNYRWKAHLARQEIEKGIYTAIPFGKLIAFKVVVPLIRKAVLDATDNVPLYVREILV